VGASKRLDGGNRQSNNPTTERNAF